MNRTVAILVFAALAGASTGQAQQRTVTQQSAATDATAATSAGALAGGSKSTVGLAAVTGSLSFALPGTGFVYLLFLHTGDVKPDFAEQAFLRDKTPEYTRNWIEGYDRALTKKQRKTIIIASTVGSLAGYFILYKPLMDRPAY